MSPAPAQNTTLCTQNYPIQQQRLRLRVCAGATPLVINRGKGRKQAIMADQGTVVGGVRDIDPNANDLQVESLARFAVDEHNKKENVTLEYKRLLGAKTQVVAGTMHHLTVEVADGETNKVYEAKVLEKAWENLKKLEHFNHVRDV